MAKDQGLPSPLLEGLNNVDRAAILLIMLGKDRAAEVFKHLSDDMVERVTIAISKMRYVTPDMRQSVLDELKKHDSLSTEVVHGGENFIKEALKDALGDTRAFDVINRANILAEEGMFTSLKNVDLGQLTAFLRQEQPQTIALIASHLEPSQAANILQGLPEELQGEVVTRIAVMEQTDPDIARQVEGVLKSQLASSYSETRTRGGAKAVAELLNFVDRSTEKSILRILEENEQELAEEVKKLMFVFEDIIYVEDRSMQRVLKEVDTSEISLALKASSEEVKEKIFNNISKRAGEMIKEEIEFMGPVRLKDVEEAQQRIVNVVRRLEEEGEIVISGRGGGKEEIIV